MDCGHSLANDESVWTPGENVGRNIEFSSTCWLIKHGSEWLLWDTGVPEATLNDPRGWSTLPKLIVYHLDKSLTDQLAEIGLKPGDIGRVAISHTHGDHIGNMGLFPNSTVVMQQAEYSWIHSPNGPNDNVNQLMALARKLLGTPKNLQLIDGDTDVFGDGSVTLVSTPGHTPGHQSLLIHLRNSGFIILSGDVVHLEGNFEKNIDVVYNQCRMYVGDTTPESRKNWIADLDRLAALNPTIVVAGHKKPGAPDSPSAIQDTKRYLEDFDRVQKTATSDQDLFDQMTALYPGWVANQSWLMFGFPGV